jgi:hypothetical protein
MDSKAVQLALLSRANNRAEQRQLNVPLSERLAGHSFSGGISGGQATVSHPIQQTRTIRGKGRDGRVVADKLPLKPDAPAMALEGRGKRQGRKDREDEKLAMEVKGLKDMEGGRKHFHDHSGGGTLEIRHHGGAKKAQDLGRKYMEALMKADPELAELHGAGLFDKFLEGAKTFGKGFMLPIKAAGAIGEATGIAPLAAIGKATKAVGLGKGRKKAMKDMEEVDEMEDEIGVGGAGAVIGGGKKKRAASAVSSRRRARGQAISRLMKEQGMTLGQASKYIKEHGQFIRKRSGAE